MGFIGSVQVECLGAPKGTACTATPKTVALSSRNAYLSSGERAAATVLYKALAGALEAVISGERSSSAVRDLAAAIVGTEPLVRLEYAELVQANDLDAVERIDDGVEHVVALAASVGPTRLIDNATFLTDGHRVAADLYGFDEPPKER